jgi:pimeloyl-ACP methyl ester carboxylesterase
LHKTALHSRGLSPIVAPVATAIVLGLLQGCTHLAVDDCGGQVLGVNEPRIRSSHFRMLLADLPAASNRFAAEAAMSALAYAEDADCGNEPKLTGDDRAKLEAALHARGWQENRQLQWSPPCEDGTGMFFRVWTSTKAGSREVVVAFRGTWGFKDWLYGNFHWFTRFLPIDDQYDQAREAMQRVFEHFRDQPGMSTRFFTTGHSLGGGLAQHALYTYPLKVMQAVAFDPTPVTGFTDQTPANQVAACACSARELNGEPRIYRVYDAYEVLANLRIVHKILFRPHRHIQEIRFPNARSHSMKGLAFYLLDNAGTGPVYAVPWYAGKGSYTAGESCTAAFIRGQRNSCEAVVTEDSPYRCPP